MSCLRSREITSQSLDNMFKKFFLIVLLILLIAPLSAFAINSSYKNSLDKVEIKQQAGENYSLNLIFDKHYTEPLTLQKKGQNLYSVILPETKLLQASVPVLGDKKDNLKINIEHYPYLDKSINNGYVKITITTQGKGVIKNISQQTTASYKVLYKKASIKTITKNPISKTSIATKQEQKQNSPKVESSVKQTEATKTLTQSSKITEEPFTLNYLNLAIELSILFLAILLAIKKVREIFKEAREREQFKFARTKLSNDAGFKTEFEKLKQKEDELLKASTTKDIIDSKRKMIDEAIIDEENKIIEKIEKTPALISDAKIDQNKGFYLVNYEDQIALIGYINDDIFFINKFDELKGKNLQMRLNETTEGKSTYIVRIDDYKALIEVSEENMNLLIEF